MPARKLSAELAVEAGGEAADIVGDGAAAEGLALAHRAEPAQRAAPGAPLLGSVGSQATTQASARAIRPLRRLPPPACDRKLFMKSWAPCTIELEKPE